MNSVVKSVIFSCGIVVLVLALFYYGHFRGGLRNSTDNQAAVSSALLENASDMSAVGNSNPGASDSQSDPSLSADPYAGAAVPTPSFTDNNVGENIIIKTDKGSYDGDTEIPVYFSLENTSAAAQNTHVQFYFPKNVSVALTHLQHKTSAGWEDVSVSQVSFSRPSAYSKSKPIPSALQAKNSFDVQLGSGETGVFRVIIVFQNESQGEFWVEAIGDNGGYGLLDPAFKVHFTFRGGGSSASGNPNFKFRGGGNGSGAISMIQATHCGTVSSGTSEDCVITSTGSGHLLVLVGQLVGTGSTISAVSGGGTWVQVPSARVSSTACGCALDYWYAKNSSSGTTDIIITKSNQQFGAVIYEFSNTDTSNPLDQVNTLANQTATTNPLGPSVTTTRNGEIVLSSILTGGDTSAVALPFTDDWVSSPAFGSGFAHDITSGRTTFTPSWTTTNFGWSGSTISFRATSSGQINFY